LPAVPPDGRSPPAPPKPGAGSMARKIDGGLWMPDLDRRVTIRYSGGRRMPPDFPVGYEAPDTAVVDPALWGIYDDIAARNFGPWIHDEDDAPIRLHQGPAETTFELHRQRHGGLNGVAVPGWPIAVTQGTETVVGYTGAPLREHTEFLRFYLTRAPFVENEAADRLRFDDSESLRLQPWVVRADIKERREWAAIDNQGQGGAQIQFSADASASVRTALRDFRVRYWRVPTDQLIEVIDSDGLRWSVLNWESLERRRWTVIQTQRAL